MDRGGRGAANAGVARHVKDGKGARAKADEGRGRPRVEISTMQGPEAHAMLGGDQSIISYHITYLSGSLGSQCYSGLGGGGGGGGGGLSNQYFHVSLHNRKHLRAEWV